MRKITAASSRDTSPPPPPPPPVANVTMVNVDQGGALIWTFDTTIIAVNAVGGLLDDNVGNGGSFVQTDSVTVLVTYGSACSAGDTWSIDGGNIDIEFDGGAILDGNGVGVVAG